jgi:hypothetical protein
MEDSSMNQDRSSIIGGYSYLDESTNDYSNGISSFPQKQAFANNKSYSDENSQQFFSKRARSSNKQRRVTL